MPDAPAVTIVPPSTPVKSAADVAAAAAKTTISAAAIPGPVTPLEPPKPGTARSKLHDAALKRFGDGKTTPEPGPKPARPGAKAAPAEPAGEPGAQPGAAEPGEPAAEPGAEPAAAPAAAAAAQPGEGKPPGKQSPWKLVDQFKQRALAAETKALELEKALGPEPQRKANAERVQALETQVQEMAGELRYHNAEKYDPDVKAAHEQYEGAWKRAMSELRDIPVLDQATNQPRAMRPDDLLELVNLSTPDARDLADQRFGKFADDAMTYRKEIRNLFEAKAAKLEELKKTGATRDQTRLEAYQKAQGELQGFIKTTYDQVVAEVLADPMHGMYFKPREGDEGWNGQLERGFKLVDDAYQRNVADPKLTPAERTEILRKHAAVRNRAAGWGALRHENTALKAKIAALEKDLAGYKESTPGAGGRAANGTVQPLHGMDAIRAGLQKIAH